MKNPLHSIRFGFIAFFIILIGIQGCSEKSIPTTFGDPELATGSISIPVEIVQKKNITPDMGLMQNLYLGKSTYSEADLILFRFAGKSRGNLQLFTLDDSSSTGKRQFLTGSLRLSVSDSLNSSNSFELLQLVNSKGDTIFKETEPNSQDFDIESPELSVTSLGVAQVSNIMFPDSIFRNAVEFDLDSTYLDWITDSTNTSNGIYFALRTVTPETQLLSFHSRLSDLETQPLIYIVYEREGGVDDLEPDTLTAYVSTEENLTLVSPDPSIFPVIQPENYSFGNILGRAVEIRFNLDNEKFPKQVLISDADLNITFDHESIGNGYSFRTSGIKYFGDENEFIDGGNFETDVNDTVKILSMRDLFQRYVSSNIDSLQGVLLSPARTMDPFSHAVISNISDSIRIDYVYPE